MYGVAVLALSQCKLRAEEQPHLCRRIARVFKRYQRIAHGGCIVRKHAFCHAYAAFFALIQAVSEPAAHRPRRVRKRPSFNLAYPAAMLIHYQHKAAHGVAHGVVIPWGQLGLRAVAAPGISPAALRDHCAEAFVSHYVCPRQRRYLPRGKGEAEASVRIKAVFNIARRAILRRVFLGCRFIYARCLRRKLPVQACSRLYNYE